jgi:hypothetical protein
MGYCCGCWEGYELKLGSGIFPPPRITRIQSDAGMRGGVPTVWGDETKELLRTAALNRLTPNKQGYNLAIIDTVTNTLTTHSSTRKGVVTMKLDQSNTLRFLRKSTKSGSYLKRYKLASPRTVTLTAITHFVPFARY